MARINSFATIHPSHNMVAHRRRFGDNTCTHCGAHYPPDWLFLLEECTGNPQPKWNPHIRVSDRKPGTPHATPYTTTELFVVKTLTSPVVGMKHHPGAIEAMADLTMGQELLLRREPNNAYDSNAVAVFLLYETGEQHMGYLPRGIAAVIADLLDTEYAAAARNNYSSPGPAKWPCRVSKITPKSFSVDVEFQEHATRGHKSSGGSTPSGSDTDTIPF